MTRNRLTVLVAVLPLFLSACAVGSVAKTAVDVALLPVKAVGKGIDAVTTSQAEADEKRGREARKADEGYGEALRKWADECNRALAAGQECVARPQASDFPA